MFYTILMASSLAATFPSSVRMRRRGVVGAQKPHINFPAMMLPVAFFVDILQMAVSGILVLLAVIPGIGLIFIFIGFIANILVTVLAFLFFRFWLFHSGFNTKIILAVFLTVLVEIFASGILPAWTLFALRMRYIAHLENKKIDAINKASAVFAA